MSLVFCNFLPSSRDAHLFSALDSLHLCCLCVFIIAGCHNAMFRNFFLENWILGCKCSIATFRCVKIMSRTKHSSKSSSLRSPPPLVQLPRWIQDLQEPISSLLRSMNTMNTMTMSQNGVSMSQCILAEGDRPSKGNRAEDRRNTNHNKTGCKSLVPAEINFY